MSALREMEITMNKQSIRSILTSAALTLCLVACDLPRATPTQTNESIDATETQTSIPAATQAPISCPSAASYGQISEYWPSRFHIESTTPTFTWFYSIRGRNMSALEEWATICVPATYSIYLSTGPDYDDEFVIQVQDPSIDADITKLTMGWTSDVPLELNKDYRWYVVGHSGDITIDDWGLVHLHDDAWWPPRSTYFSGTFRTGLECEQGAISVPELNSPLDGAAINTVNPTLTWDINMCMPLVFKVEISTNPAFENFQSGVIPNLPQDYTVIRQSDYPWMYVEYILRDCTEYYWRVTGGIGEGGEGGYREWGTPSGVRTFHVDQGQCPTPTPTLVPTVVPVFPTDTPIIVIPPTAVPVVCAGMDETQCKQHSQECEWVVPATTAPYCKAR